MQPERLAGRRRDVTSVGRYGPRLWSGPDAGSSRTRSVEHVEERLREGSHGFHRSTTTPNSNQCRGDARAGCSSRRPAPAPGMAARRHGRGVPRAVRGRRPARSPARHLPHRLRGGGRRAVRRLGARHRPVAERDVHAPLAARRRPGHRLCRRRGRDRNRCRGQLAASRRRRLRRRAALARHHLRRRRRPAAVGVPDPGRLRRAQHQPAAPARRRTPRRRHHRDARVAGDDRRLPRGLQRLPRLQAAQARHRRPGLERAHAGHAQSGRRADRARRRACRPPSCTTTTQTCSCRRTWRSPCPTRRRRSFRRCRCRKATTPSVA